MTVTKLDCPSQLYRYKCPYPMSPDRIVIHNTGNDAPADREVCCMQNNQRENSFHYAVDDRGAVQGIALNRNAWHAGDGQTGAGNRRGSAVTICYSKSGGDRFIKSVRNGAKLAHHLLAAYGWDISSVTKHQDYSGKSCPHRILDEIGFDAFLSLVSAQAITGVSGAVKRLCALGLVNESDSSALERADPPMQQLLINGAKTILKKGKNSPDVEQALNRLGGAGLIHWEDGRWWQRQAGRWEALLLALGGAV